MKFCVKNDLSIFEFHDSEFSFVSYDGTDLVVSASMVNIHKDTPQNTSDHDLEITSAQITFKNFHSPTYEPGRVWEMGEDGKSYPVGPQVIFREKDAIDRILEELQNEITVFYFEKEDHGYSIGGCGIEPYFTMEFDFDHVIVCWDEYKEKAWYELYRQYRYDAVLQTPNGDVTVELRVGYDEEPLYYKESLEQQLTVNVGCTFDD